jgi:hypothetical protein
MTTNALSSKNINYSQNNNEGGKMLGLRILIESPYNSGNFYVQYEFTGPQWKRNALSYLPYYMGRRGIRFQTLHHFTSSYDIETGAKYYVGDLWLDNMYIRPEYLN